MWHWKVDLWKEFNIIQDNPEIELELSLEGKKNISNSEENTLTLLYSEEGCLIGVEELIEKQSSVCEDGVKQEYQSNSNSLSVVFTPCIEIGWLVFIISGISLVLLSVVILLIFSPLKKYVTPYRRRKWKVMNPESTNLFFCGKIILRQRYKYLGIK